MTAATITPAAIRHAPSRRALRSGESLVLPRGTLVCPPPVRLEMQMGWLRRPIRREAVWLNDSLLSALADRDGRWVMTCLELAGPRLSRTELLHAIWLPLAIGSCLLDARAQPLHHRDEALAVLRRRIRDELRSSPADEDTIWVIPTGSDACDRAAAHVAAACLAVRALDARPWSWPEAPPSGRVIRCGANPGEGYGNSTISLLPAPGIHHISCLVQPGIPF